MYHILPGTGLGFAASKQIALGLGTGFIEVIVEVFESAYSFVREFVQRSFVRARIR